MLPCIVCVAMYSVCCHVWFVLPCIVCVAMYSVCCHVWFVLPCMVCVAVYGLCWLVWYGLPCTCMVCFAHAGTELSETVSSEVMFEYYISHHNVEGAMQFVIPPTKGGDLALCHPEEAVAMCSKMAATRYMQDSLLDQLARLVLLDWVVKGVRVIQSC